MQKLLLDQHCQYQRQHQFQNHLFYNIAPLVCHTHIVITSKCQMFTWIKKKQINALIIYLKRQVPRDRFAGSLVVQIHPDRIQAGQTLPAESQAGHSHLVDARSRRRMDGIAAA